MSVLLLSIIVSSASGIFIELESSTIGSEPKEYSATLSNSASVFKFGQCAKSRQRSEHKAIRKKLRNLFNLNSIKANLKLKQTTTVGQTIDQGSTVSKLCHRQRAKINQSNIKLQYLHQNLRHLTLFWILDYKNVFKFQIRICSWLLVGTLIARATSSFVLSTVLMFVQ